MDEPEKPESVSQEFWDMLNPDKQRLLADHEKMSLTLWKILDITRDSYYNMMNHIITTEGEPHG